MLQCNGQIIFGKQDFKCRRMCPSRVILEQDGDTALLGVTTLESIGLVLNLFTKTLHPMELLLAGLR